MRVERLGQRRGRAVERQRRTAHVEVALPAHPAELDAGERVCGGDEQVGGRAVRDDEVHRQRLVVASLDDRRADQLHRAPARGRRLGLEERACLPRGRPPRRTAMPWMPSAAASDFATTT